MIDNNEITIDLLKLAKEYLKKLWLIVLAGAILGGAMFAYGKATYVPHYKATVVMHANTDSEFYASNTSVDMLAGTCIAMLNTRKTLETVASTSGVDISYATLSGMISTETIAKSPLFRISVTGTNAEETALIANTIADVLPKMVSTVYSASNVGVVDYALVPTSPVSDNIIRNTALAAILGAALICGAIAVKMIYTDWKAGKKA